MKVWLRNSPRLKAAGCPASNPARRGFTLIEIVLAAGLLAIGLSALIGLFSFGASLVAQARLRAEAAQALEGLAADLPVRLFPLDEAGRVGEPVALADQPVPGHPFLVYDAIPGPSPASAPGEPGPPLWPVRLEVRWRSRGQKQGLAVVLLLPQSLPHGERLRRSLTSRSGP